MFQENLTPLSEITLLDYKSPLFVLDVFKYVFNFTFAPLPYEINNIFRFIQFVENLIIFFILLFFIKNINLIKKTIFWIISLFLYLPYMVQLLIILDQFLDGDFRLWQRGY